WLVWDGTRWRPDSTGQVYAWARDVARHYFEVSATLAKRADELDSEARDEADPDKRKQLVQRS
ncbi:MAG TPA: hypothetical protein VFA32_19665, partial [Dehalococcoidia bacterium]|nr:hypothetical protein [Dehalococcoidia bacterium]